MFNVFKLYFSFFLFFNTTLGYSNNYDSDVLGIFSKIMPRLILMSSQKERVKKNINICVVREKSDKKFVQILINKTNINYPKGLKNYKIKFITTEFTAPSLCKSSQLIFFFNSDSSSIRKFVLYTKKYQLLTFSYNAELLNSGIDISLYIGRKIVPYLNINNLKNKNIELNPLLLRISKIYTKENDAKD